MSLLALTTMAGCGSSSAHQPDYSNCLVIDGVPIECDTTQTVDGGTVGWGTSATGSGGSQTSGSGGSPTNTDGTGATQQPFTKPFTALISQAVPYSVAVVTIAAARLTRGTDPAFLPGQTYAELDLTIQNTSNADVDYSARSTWDLELADGTRVRSVYPVGIVIAAGYSAKTTLAYPVGDGATLAGAVLILDSDQRGVVETEHVPLDAKWSSPYPIEIATLRGVKAISPNHLSELDIARAFVELNDATKFRTALGQKFVRLEIVATSDSSAIGFTSIGNDVFRLVVDGLAVAPSNETIDSVDDNTSVKFPVVFEAAKDAQTFDVRLNWGGNPAASTVNQTFHVDLTTNSAAPVADGGAP